MARTIVNEANCVTLMKFIHSDVRINEVRIRPIKLKLRRKYFDQVYKSELAVKSWQKITTFAAMELCAITGDMDEWKHIYNYSTRLQCAELLEDEYRHSLYNEWKDSENRQITLDITT